MSKDIVQPTPRTYMEWTSSNFWFQLLFEHTEAGISQSRSMILFNTGIRQIVDVWVEEYQRFLSSQQVGARFGLLPSKFRYWDMLCTPL
jgi:hypothetical protein